MDTETIETVGILGLGYVGLPLAVAFAEAGLHVVGFDPRQDKVASISAGESYIEDVPSATLARLVSSGVLEATTHATRLASCGALLICVPTPLGEYREPDLSYVLAAAETAIANLAPSALIVLESTTWPGTTREVLAPMLAAAGATSVKTPSSPSARNVWTPATRAGASVRHPRWWAA